MVRSFHVVLRFQIIFSWPNLFLVPFQAFARDTGEYTCEAENVAGRAQSTATIMIQARLMAPHFIKGLKSQVIHEGQSVRLIVKVDGRPPPTVTW